MDFPVLLDGKTYDLKRFLHDHPGGMNTIKQYKGKSVLQAMEKFEHSSSAYHMLSDFKVEDQVKIEDNNLTGGVSANGRIITTEESNRDVEEINFLEELESRLDWSKPLLPQLDLIAPHYELWVHSAVYRRCRLFGNPVVESLTFTPWYLVPMVWLPTILYLGWRTFMEFVSCGDSCTGDQISVFQFIYHLLLGVLIWTSLEYSLHRWVFHLDPGNNLTLVKIHFLIHGLHHKMPFDDLRQVFPPVPAAMLVSIIYLILTYLVSYPSIKLVGGLADNGINITQLKYLNENEAYLKELCPTLGPRIKLKANIAAYLDAQIDEDFKFLYKEKQNNFELYWNTFFEKFIQLKRHEIGKDEKKEALLNSMLDLDDGYLTYDMIHVYVHKGSPKDGSYLYKMKRYHSNHHFVNHDKAFGISCDIWDHVFRTFANVKNLGFSLQW